MKVYIVLSKWGDDSWIRTVCDTKSQADEIANTLAEYEPKTVWYEVEQWEVQSPSVE